MSYLPGPLLSYGAFGEQAVTLKRAKSFLNFAYNVNASFVNTVTAAGGAVAASSGRAQLNPGTANGGRAKVFSQRRLNYVPGTGVTIRFTGVFTPQNNNIQILGYGGDNNGLFMGFENTVFGINRRSGGVDNWTPQTLFNLDKADGNGELPAIDFGDGNGWVFQITWQWLGYGAILFSAENPESGRYVDMHRIKYAGTSPQVSFLNPSQPLMAESINTGATGAAGVLLTPSMGGYSDFPAEQPLGPLFGFENTKNFGPIASYTNLFTVRNDTSFAGQPNNVMVTPLLWTGSQDGNQLATFRLVKNATLGGVPVFNAVQANESVMSVDVAGTTVTGGRFITAFSTAVGSSNPIPLEPIDLPIAPGDTLTVAAIKLAGAAANHASALTWREGF